MDLNTMRTMVRRDLKDEDSENYRWTDEELDRHIAHALKEFSEAYPSCAKLLAHKGNEVAHPTGFEPVASAFGVQGTKIYRAFLRIPFGY